MGVSATLIFFSPLFPIFNVSWVLPGEDLLGNPILTTIDNFYSIVTLISEFSNGYPFWIQVLPYIYILCTIAFGVLYVRKMLKAEGSVDKMALLLIFPLIVSIISLVMFTVYGLVVFIAIVSAIALLFIFREECFIEKVY